MGKEKISTYKIINYAGAFIALLIGSGFATGQEVMQYFSSYGYMGALGTLAVFILLAYVGIDFITTGYDKKFEKGNDIYYHYCGKYLGAFYDYFSTFFIFLSFTVMIAGASATGVQHYQWPSWLGGSAMVVLVTITVLFGLSKIVDVIGNIGPVIITIAIFLGIASIITNMEGLKNAPEILQTVEVKKASTNWFLAASSYVGFCMLWLAAFLAQVGKSAKNRKEAKYGALFGALGFSVAVFLVYLGILGDIKNLAGSQIPSLLLAQNVHPVLATVFSVIIFAGIYTTAVPLLWSVVARFFKEKTTNFKIATVVLAILGGIIGLNLQFDQLVNVVYVLNGYVGIVLLIIMIFRSITARKKS